MGCALDRACRPLRPSGGGMLSRDRVAGETGADAIVGRATLGMFRSEPPGRAGRSMPDDNRPHRPPLERPRKLVVGGSLRPDQQAVVRSSTCRPGGWKRLYAYAASSNVITILCPIQPERLEFSAVSLCASGSNIRRTTVSVTRSRFANSVLRIPLSRIADIVRA
jgi:hypothetical protein